MARASSLFLACLLISSILAFSPPHSANLIAPLISPHRSSPHRSIGIPSRAHSLLLSTSESIESIENTLDNGSTLIAPTITPLSPLPALLTKLGMFSFLASLILSLSLSLPLLRLAGFILRWKTATLQRQSFWYANFTARTCLKLFPFARFETKSYANSSNDKHPQPTVWTCNHQSMLDIFFMLAGDKKLRGRNRRPIKVSTH